MKSKIIFGNMIDYFRQQSGLTMEELGQKLGKSKSSISRWVSGERYPKIEEIEEIAHFFNTDVATLIFGFKNNATQDDLLKIYNELDIQRQNNVYDYAAEQLNEQNNVVNMSDYIQEETEWYEVKFYGSVSAGTGLYLEDEQVETISFGADMVPASTDFCLKVNGDSMEPTFHDGDYVFIKRETEFRNGTIGAVIVNGEAYLKKLYITDDSIKLVSLNKKYQDITVTDTDNFKYVGTVVF
jgi:phage repressor protein, putative